MSYNKAFGVETNPQSLGAKVLSYSPGASNVFMEGMGV